MSPLVDAAITGPMRRAPGRTTLLVIAIALGVALGCSIYLINRSAADEVSLAARSLYGLADLAIESETGFDEELYPRVARLPGIAVASPVVEVQAKIAGRRGSLTLLGVDGFRSRLLQSGFAALAGSMQSDSFGALDPRAVFLSANAARELQLQAGDELRVQIGVATDVLHVVGVLPPAALEDRAGMVDIAAAQWKFGRIGQLSRINLRLASGAGMNHVREQLTALLPHGARITSPGEAGNEALRLSRAYRSNLTALALVALFTGGFFIYSTQSLATLRRRREFAILHALGVTRRQQLLLMLTGSAALGLAGAVLGVVLGIVTAKFGLSALGGDLGAGYFGGLESELRIHPPEVIAFCLLGVAVAVAGALRPSLDAAHIPTASALKAGDVAARVRTHGLLVLALLALAAVALVLPPISGLPLPGYVAIALLLIAVVAALPSIFSFLLRRAPSARAVPYQVAIAQIAGTTRYATLSVAAIVVSFSLMVSMAIMVTSFRTSLDHWAQRLLPADVYVRVGYLDQSAYLDDASVQRIGKLPGIARVETSRLARVQIAADRPAATLVARSLDPKRIEQVLWITQRASTAPPAGSVPVWVSETASDLFGIHAGDSLQLSIGRQPLTAFVRAIWRDYEHQNGAIVLDRNLYARLTGDTAANTVWLWLQDGASLPAVASAIRNALPGVEYDLRTPGDVRRLSLAAFDRTFAVTYLLELVAVLIGLFGIATGVSAQVLARRGEFGALRHLGFTRAQIAGLLAIEGSVLGALGVVVGLVSGAAVGLVLIYVVNRQSFHWSMDLDAPAGLLAGLSAALIAAAALIAVFSGRQAMSADVVTAVKEDW